MRRSQLTSVLIAVLALLVATGKRQGEPQPEAGPPFVRAAPTVAFRAASGATIEFRTQNGEMVDGILPVFRTIPHLVLRRNGILTDPRERTLVVDLSGIPTPEAVTATIDIVTQHVDPDPEGGGKPIVVWTRSLLVPKAGSSTTFTITFGAEVREAGGNVPMPTDYLQLRLSLHGAGSGASALQASFERDSAFLVENQWITRLPDVQEESLGAAPDELLVYYCDMFPFQRDRRDASSRLRRAEVEPYVKDTLLPAIVEAFRTQSAGWGFMWHDAWTTFRASEDSDRLTVALTDSNTWFHGGAPVTGHSGISLNTNAPVDFAAFDTLTDALMSTFHHELFHNLQRSIHQHQGGDGDVGAGGAAWHFLSEGPAFLASTVGVPSVYLGRGGSRRRHVSNANTQIAYFVWGSGSAIDLCGALYWRFLYEQCGGMRDGVEDPAAGMTIVRSMLNTLYSREMVDMSAPYDPLKVVARVMDRALDLTPSCPFHSFEDSLAHFGRAVYGLGLEGGRCTAPGQPAGCGLFDPSSLYKDLPAGRLVYSDERTQTYHAAIRRSFGVTFVDIVMSQPEWHRPLVIEFHSTSGKEVSFVVQAWKLADRRAVGEPVVLTQRCPDGRLVHVVDSDDTGAWDRLGLIIVRTDTNERPGTVAGFTVRVRASDADNVPCSSSTTVDDNSAGYVGA